MSYEYKNPIKNGYNKVKKSKYKELIKNYKWHIKYEVYENSESYLVHTFEPLLIIILNILLFPVFIIIYGLSSISEISINAYNIIFQKKTGSFQSQTIWKNKSNQDNIDKTLENIK